MQSERLNTDNFYDLADICSDVLFWETDENFVITYINSALEKHTGLKPADLVGKKLAEFLKLERVEEWQQAISEQQKYKNFKFKISFDNGQFAYINSSGKILKRNSKIIGYYGICTIETEGILTEKVIKRLRVTNKTILESLTNALVIVDKTEKFIVVSPEFNSMWGFKKGKVFLNPMKKTVKKMKKKLAIEPSQNHINFSDKLYSTEKQKDILELIDGRIIEQRSSPFINDGKVIGRCWHYQDVTQQVKLVKRLGKLAFRDSLTKLYSRRWCERKLKQLLISNRQKDNKLSFLYMDLDHFKVINDSCGHIHGDDVLEEISQLLLATIGEKAYLSRLGGDEFGLILANKSQAQALAIAEKVKQAITGYTYQWKNKIFKIGISIGIVFVTQEDDFRSVFVHADEACYLSKETGRNKCTVYNVDKKEFQKTQTELKWYDAIQKALLKGKFELWCQSINAMNSTKKHYEVLLRMRGKNDDLISPAHFMEAADRFGMLFTIDKRVIEMFFKFYHENQAHLGTTLFSINLSGHSLSRDGFLPFVLGCLDRYSINCKNICFEITENEIIKNLDKALEFINHVKSLGCKISLDDFGKGLTSFSYLKNIPYDFIKIDGQFIKGYQEDKINEAVIKSIVYIAEVMNTQTIAEHIESKEILTAIKALGVNYFQGNYFSEPHQITKLLE